MSDTPVPRRLKGAIDLDDVLLDLVGEVLVRINRTRRPDQAVLTPADVRTWDATLDGMPKSEWFWPHFETMRKDGSYWDIPPLDAMSKWYFNRLARSHDISIVTSRPAVDEPFVHLWLQRNGFTDVPVVCTKSSAEKASLPFDFFVDDAPTLLEPVQRAGKRLILLSRPWNREARLHPGAVRVKQWSEIVDLVDFLAGGSQ